MSEVVRRKSQSVRLWSSGAYGNKLRCWHSRDELVASGYGGLVVIRVQEGGGGQHCIYDVPPERVAAEVEVLLGRGVQSSAIMFNEALTVDRLTLQGEYWNGPYLGPDGYPTSGFLVYSRSQLHMRRALAADPQATSGIRADLILARYMSPGSLEDWQVLLAEYPEHVFEVSVFDHYLGDVPRRNALVWEVRRY
jgi:hypothetical protein